MKEVLVKASIIPGPRIRKSDGCRDPMVLEKFDLFSPWRKARLPYADEVAQRETVKVFNTDTNSQAPQCRNSSPANHRWTSKINH